MSVPSRCKVASGVGGKGVAGGRVDFFVDRECKSGRASTTTCRVGVVADYLTGQHERGDEEPMARRSAVKNTP